MYIKPFIDAGFPTNIVMGKINNAPPLLDMFAVGILGQVVVEAAIKYPMWTFTVSSIGGNKNINDVNEYYPVRVRVVRSDGTEVGKLESDSSWRSNTIVELHNTRISRAMSRGTYLRTSKPDKAIKLIKKYFTDPTPTEMMEEVNELLYMNMNHRASEFRNVFSNNYRTYSSELMPFLIENIDEVFERNPHLSKSVDKVKLVDSLDNHNIANKIQHALPAEKLTVVLRDDKYVLQRAGTPVMVKTSDQLPAELRTSIGMLKLVENGQFVRDVGYRLNPDKFMVIFTGELT
jgi:hypothetical protein